jgi:HAE1 family hydrophobic/amphiphilic exporter-1/multidrug efflux pump
LGGLVGEMYRQFAITISVSVFISGFVALTLIPALCALLLKPESKTHLKPSRIRTGFERLTLRYAQGVGRLLRHGVLAVCLFAAMLAATIGMMHVLPTSLVPEEDQGYVIALPFLPPAASRIRTDTVMKTIERHFQDNPAVLETVSFSGADPYNGLPRSNTGFSFITLRPWSERSEPEQQSSALVAEVMGLDTSIKDALVYGAAPPPIEGLSSTGGFEGFVQSRAGNDYKALEEATAKLVAAAAERPELVGVFSTFTAQVPQLRMELDRDRVKMLGLNITDVFATLQSTFGAYYVNDFNMLGRVYRVQMQSDASYRAHVEDLRHVYVRSVSGTPIPITALGEIRRVTGPDMVERFNVFPAARVLGAPAPGYSSGQALEVMEQLAAEHLPEGYTLEWNAQAWLEKQTQQNTAGIYLLGMFIVFLILMAQYERVTLPFAVILSLPFAVFGALTAVWLRGLYNDLYLQIGLVTLIGLAAKNAVLIVEFAARLRQQGASAAEAAMESVRLRFRPIVMTSLAFILGVLPLAISTGAGANARHAIGTGVIGDMIAATFIATLFTPVFFCWTERWAIAMRGAFRRIRRASAIPADKQ